MKNSRREFIKAGAIGAAVSATGIPLASLAGEKDGPRCSGPWTSSSSAGPGSSGHTWCARHCVVGIQVDAV